MPLPPLNGSTGGFTSRIFGNPKVLVQRKDGKVEELTPGELRRRIDPNNDGDDWFTKMLEKAKDFFSSLLDRLNNSGNSLFR